MPGGSLGPVAGPMDFKACMARDWPGVDDKEAFCAQMHRGELGKRLTGERVSISIPITKIDEEQRIVTGWAALSLDASGQPVIDYQGDYIPVEDLQKAAQQLMADGGTGRAGDMHVGSVGDIVEIAMLTPDILKRLGYANAEGPSGLMVSMKIHDDAAWAAVKSGERRELSIGGIGERTPMAA